MLQQIEDVECERDCGDKDLEELVQDLLPLGVLIDTVNSWVCY